MTILFYLSNIVFLCFDNGLNYLLKLRTYHHSWLASHSQTNSLTPLDVRGGATGLLLTELRYQLSSMKMNSIMCRRQRLIHWITTSWLFYPTLTGPLPSGMLQHILRDPIVTAQPSTRSISSLRDCFSISTVFMKKTSSTILPNHSITGRLGQRLGNLVDNSLNIAHVLNPINRSRSEVNRFPLTTIISPG